MKLEKLDAIEVKAAKTSFAAFAQVFGASVRLPLIRPGPSQASFGGDYQAFRVRMQGLRNEPLGDKGAVRVGHVDEGDAQVHGAPKNSNALGRVFGFIPDSLARQTHRAETKAVNRSGSADFENAALRGRLLNYFWHFILISKQL